MSLTYKTWILWLKASLIVETKKKLSTCSLRHSSSLQDLDKPQLGLTDCPSILLLLSRPPGKISLWWVTFSLVELCPTCRQVVVWKLQGFPKEQVHSQISSKRAHLWKLKNKTVLTWITITSSRNTLWMCATFLAWKSNLLLLIFRANRFN